MWASFKAFPATVKFAIVFLLTIITVSCFAAPHIAIPLLMVVGTIFSILRLLVYFFHRI